MRISPQYSGFHVDGYFRGGRWVAPYVANMPDEKFIESLTKLSYHARLLQTARKRKIKVLLKKGKNTDDALRPLSSQGVYLQLDPVLSTVEALHCSGVEFFAPASIEDARTALPSSRRIQENIPLEEIAYGITVANKGLKKPLNVVLHPFKADPGTRYCSESDFPLYELICSMFTAYNKCVQSQKPVPWPISMLFGAYQRA